MCGFAGFLDPTGRLDPAGRETAARAMATALAPRGPDDEGLFVDPDGPVTLAFRRLAILDLTAAGHQPMLSACGRYVLAYNGETYNFEALRAALDAQTPTAWRGGSDSEVLLEALVRWGAAATLDRLDGMFAFALWDRRDRRLLLARDRFGEKPLVYGWQGATFLFGSTLHALAAHPAFRREIDPTAVAAYFQRGYVPSPLTIQTGIAKLPPGTWVEIAGDARPGNLPLPRPYFDPVEEAERAAATPFDGSREEALDRLQDLLSTSVRRRLRADVPLGVFLSGGIDSSTVAALAAETADRPIRSFTISFPDAADDEAPYAAKVAAHLGTDHATFRVTEADALDMLDRLGDVYDEPFADPSALPSMVLCRQVRTAVTVALSGDGGDEFFAGYDRYRTADRDVTAARARPAWLRGAARTVGPAIPWAGAKRSVLRLAAADPRDAYLPYIARWRRGSPARGDWTPPDWPPTALPPIARFLAADAADYLPDNLQVKMDRASMGVGLEVRAPLLDPAVARFAWSLPVDWRLNPTEGSKVLLRRFLARKVPPALFERPKQGFYQPLPAWLRGNLRDWAEDLLSERALAASGLLDPAPVRAAWRDHLGGRNRALDLWAALVFQQWLRTTGQAAI